MRGNVNVFGICIGLLAAISSPVVPAYAQTSAEPVQSASSESGTIEEITVTAQRRAESIMSVPLAVSAFSQNDLANLGISNSSDLAGQVPSLQVNSAFGAVQPNFTVRGIGVANEHNPNQASPIGVYFDDAYIASRAAQGLQLFDLDRVEILRGPQGTLYGRNTTGGAINFISQQPSLGESNGYYEVGYGNYNTVTAQAAGETTISPNVAGLRVAFNYAHGDGYEQNIFPAQPAGNSTDSVAGRAILRVKPNDDLDVILKITLGRSNPTQAGVYDLGTGPNGNNTALNYSRAAHGLSFWQIDSDRLGYNFVATHGAELIVKYNFNDRLALETLTSFDYANAVFTQEGTGVNSPVFKQPLDTWYGNRFTMFNQEARITYTTEPTKVQAGVYYGYDSVKSNSYYWLLDGAADVHQQFTQVRQSYAVFAQADQSLTRKLSATLGVRYTVDRSKYEDYSSYLVPDSISFTGERNTGGQYWPPSQGVFFLGSYDPATGQIVSGPTIKLNSNKLTGRAALTYTFDSGQIVYASFSRGYRSAAYCGQCFLQTTIDQTKPETDDAYEIGTKGQFFGRKLAISADVYLTNYKNQQINEQIGLQTILSNVPKSQMKGVELEVTANPVRDLRLVLAADYLDATFKTLTLASGVLNGYQEPYAPKVTVNGHFDWQFARIGEGTFTFTPTVIYTSNVYFSPYDTADGNGPLSQPANTKVNAQLSYGTDRYKVWAWAKNLTDQKTFGDGLDLRASFGYYYLVPLAPRTFGVSVSRKF